MTDKRFNTSLLDFALIKVPLLSSLKVFKNPKVECFFSKLMEWMVFSVQNKSLQKLASQIRFAIG